MKTFLEFIIEAKFEKDLSPIEKEDVRNKRAYGSTSSRDRATGMRRTFHAAERGAKKEIPTGNEKSEISSRFGTGAEVRREIRKLKGRKSGRDFAKKVKQELEAKRYIKKANSDFAAQNAENKIVKLRRESKTFQEFLALAEKYYSPDEKLPSGKTPEQKAEDRDERPYSSKTKQVLQQMRTKRYVRHGADNPELNRHSSTQSDVTGGPGWMSVGDKESGIYYNVTHHGRTKDGKRVFNVTWNHSDKPSELEKDPERRNELVRAAKDVWKQDVEHRLPHGSVVTNRPTENNKYDDQKGETKKNTRSKLYQRAGFGEMNPETGKQFAQVGRQLNTKQKRKGKGRLTPLSSDTEYEFTNP